MTSLRRFWPLFAALVLKSTPILASGLPPLVATDLAGKAVNFAARSKGEGAIVVTGFTKASSGSCQAWEDQLWTQRGEERRYRIFSILQLEGVPGFFMPFIKHSVRGKTPKQRWNHVFLAAKGKQAWEKYVDFSQAAPNDAYLVVVAADGNLRWKGHGTPGAKLEAEAETALKGLDPKP